ncbi:unnamed protein product [Sphagnum jensenii]|uniref:Uncharacterized protein n=1 Tax=Sphagnum jensenii TaxID=128206 RepID=A0ABP1AKX4_9BRYO
MKLFSKEEDEIVYTVTIKNVLQFELAINYVGIGMSFRQTVEAIQKAKDRMKMTKLWRAKLISMSSDGENTMTGYHAGIITHIIACVENKVLRIWCAPHQMDIVIKAAAMVAKSLLITQQEIAIVQNLLGMIITMFGIEIILLGEGDVREGSLHVSVEAIVDHIENQGSFPRNCYWHLEADDQQDVVDHIAKYAIALVTSLQSVKAGWDNTNYATEKDAPLMMPT